MTRISKIVARRGSPSADGESFPVLGALFYGLVALAGLGGLFLLLVETIDLSRREVQVSSLRAAAEEGLQRAREAAVVLESRQVELNRRIEESESGLARTRGDLNAALAELEEVRRETERQRGEASVLRVRIDEDRRMADQLATARARLEGILPELRAERDSLASALAGLQSRKEALDQEVVRLAEQAARIDLLVGERARLQGEIEHFGTARTEAEERLAAIRGQTVVAAETLARAREELAAAGQRKRDQESEALELEQRHVRLRESLEETRERHHALGLEVAERSGVLGAREAMLRMRVLERDRLEEEIKTLEAQRERASAELEATVQRLREARHARDALLWEELDSRPQTIDAVEPHSEP
ncbi:MAG: hypothetical protein JJT96_11500 [Opitutales bacterium]|nr:hypothetical protein [Opitutales bacterium]